jgi:hypothetical protein
MAKRISDEEKIKRDSEKKERIRRKKLEAYTSKYNKFSEYIRKKHEELLMEERKKEKDELNFIQGIKDKASQEYEKVLNFKKRIENYNTEFKPIIENLKPTMSNILQHEGKSFIILKALASVSDSGYSGIKTITSNFCVRESIFEDMKKSGIPYNFKKALSEDYGINFSSSEIKDLFHVRLSTSKQSSGDGEFLAALLLGGQMPQEGDIMVGEEIVEVKSSGGGGFYGFYGPNSNNYVKSKYSEMISESKKMGIPEDLLLPSLSKSGKRNWNMSRGGSKGKGKNWEPLREWMKGNLSLEKIEEFKFTLLPLLTGMFKHNTEDEIKKVVDDFFSFKIERREFHCRLAFFAADSYCRNGSGGSFEKILFFNKWSPWETVLFIKDSDGKFYNEENISRFLSTDWDINLNFTKENGNIEVVDPNGGK